MKTIITIVLFCLCVESNAKVGALYSIKDFIGTRWELVWDFPARISVTWEFTPVCIKVSSYFEVSKETVDITRPYYLSTVENPKRFMKERLGKDSQLGYYITYLNQKTSEFYALKIDSLTEDSLFLISKPDKNALGSQDPVLMKFKRIKDGESSPEGTNNNSEGTKNNDEKDDNKNYYIVPLN